MPRIRTVKPDLFDDPDIGSVSLAARWLYVGLFTQADRAGRLKDEPRRLKTRLIPYDDYDVDTLLDELVGIGVLTRYAIDGGNYLAIRNFEKHQRPHPKEAKSLIPPPVELHGQPLKAGASKVDTGSLSTGVRSTRSTEAGHPPTAPSSHPRAALTAGLSAHRSHASCGRVCVPAFLHSEFVRQLGYDEDQSDGDLRQWYGKVLDTWADKPIGDDALVFWRARFREWQGTTVAAKTSARRQPGGGTSCPHEPQCASVTACVERTLQEGRT